MFPATLDREGKRDANVGVGGPYPLYAELFTRRDLSLAIGMRKVNDISIAV